MGSNIQELSLLIRSNYDLITVHPLVIIVDDSWVQGYMLKVNHCMVDKHPLIIGILK